ncbi:hypothetical protein EYF80_003786 [Liparis tanakae]|uniref:Uncharacterized protein n=1 Tax=Liparis tanakae TaxID=230148 RepID=A0A4Z2J904_9TELE|nr:hypothetical protein EYF80_003786 [Liparis tanakae]
MEPERLPDDDRLTGEIKPIIHSPPHTSVLSLPPITGVCSRFLLEEAQCGSIDREAALDPGGCTPRSRGMFNIYCDVSGALHSCLSGLYGCQFLAPGSEEERQRFTHLLPSAGAPALTRHSTPSPLSDGSVG